VRCCFCVIKFSILVSILLAVLQEETLPADSSDIVDLSKASDSAGSNVDTDDGTMVNFIHATHIHVENS